MLNYEYKEFKPLLYWKDLKVVIIPFFNQLLLSKTNKTANISSLKQGGKVKNLK